MALTDANVLVSEARVLYAPYGTALPDETTVDYGDYPSWTGWTDFGYTTAPTNLSYSYDTFGVDVQQSTLPIKRIKTTETLDITTSIAEISGANMALILGGTNTDTAAAAGTQKEFSQVTVGGDTALLEWAFAFEGYRVDSTNVKQPVRVFIHKATIVPSGDIPFAKDAAVSVPVTISALGDGSKAVGAQLMEVHIVTGPAV